MLLWSSTFYYRVFGWPLFLRQNCVRRDPASHNFTTSFKHHVAQCPLTIKPFRCHHRCACPSSRLNEGSSSLQLRSRLRARSDACISCEWCDSWACCKWIFTDIWRSVGVDWNRPVHLSVRNKILVFYETAEFQSCQQWHCDQQFDEPSKRHLEQSKMQSMKPMK